MSNVRATRLAALTLGLAIRAIAAEPPAAAVEERDDGSAVRDLLAKGLAAEAEAEARELVTRVERERGAEALETGGALDLLVSALAAGGKGASAEALTAARRSLSIREKAFGPDDLSVAAGHVNVAVLFRA